MVKIPQCAAARCIAPSSPFWGRTSATNRAGAHHRQLL